VGEASLDAVRHLNRMIKERRFAVHPNVLSCLLHLRLKTELHDVRASQSRASKEEAGDILQKRKQRKKDGPHLSKKAKKALKDNKVIQAEMKEAEAEIDKEERANRVTPIVSPSRTMRADKSSSKQKLSNSSS
jgi:nucleolar complex protein 3